MTNIKNYYSTLNMQTKFEAFRVTPYIIHMFGRDYSHDQKSFWAASGIFFDIITKISLNEQLVDTKIEIISNIIALKIVKISYIFVHFILLFFEIDFFNVGNKLLSCKHMNFAIK